MPLDDIARGGGHSPIIRSFPTLGNIIGLLFCVFMAYRGLHWFEKTNDVEHWKSVLVGIIWELFWLSPLLLCVTGIVEWP
jgi:hypothetical protein